MKTQITIINKLGLFESDPTGFDGTKEEFDRQYEMLTNLIEAKEINYLKIIINGVPHWFKAGILSESIIAIKTIEE